MEVLQVEDIKDKEQGVGMENLPLGSKVVKLHYIDCSQNGDSSTCESSPWPLPPLRNRVQLGGCDADTSR